MVAALAVIAADREVNEGLKKHSARSPLGRPCRFENLVAGKELAIVEEIDAVPKGFIHWLDNSWWGHIACLLSNYAPDLHTNFRVVLVADASP